MIRVGSTVGNYTVVSKLGEGAMASVFLAEHPRIGKRVAIKVIHPELSTSQEMVSRFFTEARAASQIHHDNVVDIQDFGQTPDGDNFIIMEYLEGDTLASRLKQQGRLDIQQAVRVTIHLTEGLAAAHERGVIHRDLKPDNIYLVRRGGESDFPKILDFGLAKITGGPAHAEMVHKTRTGSVLGTPHYMAPEQAEGKATVDGRADIYSLGCIFYQMLTGTLPFPGDGFGEVLVKHLREPAPSPRAVLPQLSVALDKIVLHCLAKRREYRFQSVLEVGRALRDPDRFSQEIGDDPRQIVGPMPGEASGPPRATPGPLPMEPPPTLIGQSVVGLTPPPGLFPPPGQQGGATAAPEQRTMIAMPMPGQIPGQMPGQMPGQVPGQTPLNMMQTMLANPMPQQAGGARSGHTMVAEYNPSGNAPHEMPTIAPGTPLPPGIFRPPTGGQPGAYAGQYPGTGGLPQVPARPFYRAPAFLGAVGGLLLVGGGLLVPMLLRPKIFQVNITSTPPGAQVLRDGAEVGRTPYVLTMKKGDPDIKLVLHKDGFLDSVRQVQAQGGDVPVRLLPRPPKEDEDTGRPKEGDEGTKAPGDTKPETPTKPDKPVQQKPDKPTRPVQQKPDKPARPVQQKPDKPTQVRPATPKPDKNKKPKGGLIVPF